MTRVLTFSDDPRLARELASAGASIAGEESWAVELDSLREEAVSGSVLLVRSGVPLSTSHELAAKAISEAMKKTDATVVLIGSTKLGRMIAGTLAVLGGMGVLSDVRGVGSDGASLSGVRAVYAGKFTARVSSPAPCIALVPQGAYEPGSAGATRKEELTVTPEAPRTRLVETKLTERSSVDLRGAKVIVSAGRGVRKKEDLELVSRLATALGGAVGASRPLSSDLGWLGEEYHIGLTGTYVHPDLYLAVGISGQLQHVAGIKDSKVIAAINKDKLAPIFQVSDYGVVGDLYEVVPELLKLLEA